jgi:putative mRNA 3-end processing factor
MASDVESALGLELDAGGPCLRALGVWLDPTGTARAAFVSHAHAAAAARDCPRVFATHATLAIARSLGTELRNATALGWGDTAELNIDDAFGGGTARISVVPAGHALGAAQLVVDHPRGRLVYTGDWSSEADATHAAGEVVACDELVITCAFGLPIFRFEPAATVLAALATWCSARLAENVTPVVLAKTPGPAQSIVHALLALGLPVTAHDAVRTGCAAYAALGVPHQGVASHSPGARGVIVVAPADARAVDIRARGATLVAYASGWALLDAAVEQKRADAAFVLADHADCDALVAHARATGAKLVHATHGHAGPFVRMLASAGIAARGLEAPAIDPRSAS